MNNAEVAPEPEEVPEPEMRWEDLPRRARRLVRLTRPSGAVPSSAAGLRPSARELFAARRAELLEGGDDDGR